MVAYSDAIFIDPARLDVMPPNRAVGRVPVTACAWRGDVEVVHRFPDMSPFFSEALFHIPSLLTTFTRNKSAKYLMPLL